MSLLFLLQRLSATEIKLQLIDLDDKEKVYLFGLDTIRTDIPKSYSIKNTEIMNTW